MSTPEVHQYLMTDFHLDSHLIVAHGFSGSGKSFTLCGKKNCKQTDPGVIHLWFQELFKSSKDVTLKIEEIESTPHKTVTFMDMAGAEVYTGTETGTETRFIHVTNPAVIEVLFKAMGSESKSMKYRSNSILLCIDPEWEAKAKATLEDFVLS
ncbi:hypothetical protein K435DRAFT_802844 [Dendrothele bispora CBS 962.96]|uniref:Kinesin motor domain-containing protein n=1 Tax=Dendrothele bispora (strain CBS 962.96) TaxID=1314807 RepID=A0A4V6T584_DENBC|nr:hypothetical protein K435DRAFT_802844 [Dendrothele bispora CBS 962.96]